MSEHCPEGNNHAEKSEWELYLSKVKQYESELTTYVEEYSDSGENPKPPLPPKPPA